MPHELEYATSFAPISISTTPALRRCVITLRPSSCSSTEAVVAPATESLAVSTRCPVVAASFEAVRGGYGVQSQLVPRGTESPRATTDLIGDRADACARTVEAEAPAAESAHAAIAQLRASTARTIRRGRLAYIPSTLPEPDLDLVSPSLRRTSAPRSANVRTHSQPRRLPVCTRQKMAIADPASWKIQRVLGFMISSP